MKWGEIFRHVKSNKQTYFCPFCNAAGWSGSPEYFEVHVNNRHGKTVNARDCITSEVKVLGRYLEREKYEVSL